MLDRLEQQIIRSTIATLSADIDSGLNDPVAREKLQMTNLLLAHLLGRQGQPQSWETIEQEVQSLQATESGEKEALGAAAAEQEQSSTITAELMTDYLREKLEMPQVAVTEVQASLGGFSKETYLLSLSGAEQFDNKLVMRCDSRYGPVESTAADEFMILRKMFERRVPVPEPLYADRNPPFGGTALLMRRASGSSPFDVKGQQLGPQGREAALALARVLAKIHTTPLSELDLPNENSGTSLRDHVLAMLAFYKDQYSRRHIDDSPTLAKAFEWLQANIPVDGAGPALVHGDASMRNLLVDDKGQESAMLDWELWHVGDANEDLAYCRNEIESVLAWEHFLEEYRAHGGPAYEESSGAYYEVYASVRNVIFAQSLLHGFVNAENPKSKFAFAAIALGRPLVYRLADKFAPGSQEIRWR